MICGLCKFFVFFFVPVVILRKINIQGESMGKNFYPMETIRRLTEEQYGDLDLNRGKLTLTFSRDATGDANLKLFISEVFSLGLFRGGPPFLAFDCFDQLSAEHPTSLANNAQMRSGQNPDHVIIEIQTMGLA